MKKHGFLRSIGMGFAILSCLAGAQPAISGEYPEKDVTITVWSSPGAPNDILARQISKYTKYFNGHKVNVLNKKGGDGAVAMSYMLKQEKDGYNLMTTTSSQVMSMATMQIPYEPTDFSYIIRFQMDPYVIAVRADSPFNNLKDFFEFAQKNPGELTIAGYGTASAHYLAFAELQKKAGAPKVRWIAYEGGADAAVACLGGHTMAVQTNPIVVAEHVTAGKMKILGISTDERTDIFPDWPTYREQGYDHAAVQWRGVMGPAGLPEDIKMKIFDIMNKIAAEPDFKTFMKDSGVISGLLESPDAYQKAVEKETEETKVLLKELGLN